MTGLKQCIIHENAPIRKLPEQERPYEKCLSGGARSLSDAELLSVILRTGSSGESALDLSRRVIREMGEDGLTGLYHLTLEQLVAIRGIGQIKAIQLKCIGELSRRIARQPVRKTLTFTDARSVAAYYMEEYRHEEQEKVLLLMLDGHGSLIAEEEIFLGSSNQAFLNPREIFRSALRRRSVSIILLHNHPSGDPTPSGEDLEATARIRECGEMIGIELVDHIILGDRSAVSFREEMLL